MDESAAKVTPKPEVLEENHLVTLTKNYWQEAKHAKLERMLKNRLNFECYHLRQDYSHKIPGQSREVLPKQAMSVEQITTFIQQGLADLSDWFTVEKAPGCEEDDEENDKDTMSVEEATLLVQFGLDKTNFLTFIGDSVKLGLLQSLMIAKQHGQMHNKSVFYSDIKKVDNGKDDYVLKKKDVPVWEPRIDLVRAEDWYPDPKKEQGLFQVQELYMDISELYKLAEMPNSPYNLNVIKDLHGSMVEMDLQALKKARETGQNVSYATGYRKQIKLWECWGNVIDHQGKIIHEGVTWTIANERFIVKDITENPFWHGERPFITSPFIRVPHSVWHKALMDAPTLTNIAINELYNLMVDDGMNSVHGVKQIRADWLEDESQVTNGILPGITLKVNSNAPTGAKVLERVDQTSMNPETLNFYNVMCSEFSASALTNDLRMGVLPNKSVKATEVVEASQSITSVFTGVSKIIEEGYIVPNLNMMFKNMLQHLDLMDRKALAAIWGQQRADQILAMPKAVRFAKLVDRFVFNVYGVSRILQKQKDFKKIMALLQTISGDPILGEEFQKEYSIPKLLNEVMISLDIAVDKIKLSDKEKQQEAQAGQAQQQGQSGQPGGSQPGTQPDAQSQLPQATSQESSNSVESMIPHANFGGLQGKANGGMKQ